MKSVLISIQPKWVEKIAKGEKTIEVRKTRPKIETPFKCYIYETNGKQVEHCDGCDVTFYGRGKVIGEFVCNEIEYILSCYGYLDARCIGGAGYILNKCCLSSKDLIEYGKGKELYAWHISDLKIYDKPKELSEFKIECPTKNQINGTCYFCEHTHFTRYSHKHKCNAYLKRPPQSWCYVESGE